MAEKQLFLREKCGKPFNLFCVSQHALSLHLTKTSGATRGHVCCFTTFESTNWGNRVLGYG